MVGKFFQSLKENPTLIAACLVYGEKMTLESAQGFHNLLETVVLSIFGQSCATQNQTPLLEFIQCLMLHQIGSTERPRQALKRGAFISTYRLLVEALSESRLFLTAALYQPIVQVLLDEGPPLEADPNKVIGTFEPNELAARFGRKGTPEFDQKLREFCKETSRRLEEHVNRFSQSIEQRFIFKFQKFSQRIIRYEAYHMMHTLKNSQIANHIFLKMIKVYHASLHQSDT